jgi:hypothetical protein
MMRRRVNPIVGFGKERAYEDRLAKDRSASQSRHSIASAK